ncbi:MAG: hypothetical protein O3B01_12160 [Planctomycetota bacterium]|nr:hypothetical protein [Planctomycetota bacterium]
MNIGESGHQTNDLSKLEEKRSKPRKTAGTKLLIGCGVGCAGLMAVLVFTCVGTFIYFKSPAEALPGHALVSDKTIVFGQLEVDLSDRGVMALIKSIQEHQQKNDFKNSPGKLRKFFKGLQQGKSEQQIAELGNYLDLRAMVVVEKREGVTTAPIQGEGKLTDRADVMVVISLRRMANLAGMFWRFLAADAVKKGGETFKGHNLVLDDKGEWVLCLMKNNFIAASSMEGARRMVDRLTAFEEAPDAALGTVEMQDAMKAFDENADVVAAVADESTLESVIIALKDEDQEEKLPPEQVVEQVLGTPLNNIAYVTVDGDLISEQQIVLNIFMKTRQQDKAEQLATRLTYLLTAAESSKGFIQTGMVMVHEEKQGAEGVKVRIELNRFWDWFEQNLDKTGNGGKKKSEASEADKVELPGTREDKGGSDESLEPALQKNPKPAEATPNKDDGQEE